MKNIILLLILTPFVAGSYWIYNRYNSNLASTIPYPYAFKKTTYQDTQLQNIPIVIIGDRQAEKLSRLSDYMAQRISTNLSKKVKVFSLAQKGEALHRTLRKIKKLSRLPLITIYLGGSEETFEKRFYTKDIKMIKKNFKLYQDDRVKTALMIFPKLSRFLYHNITYKKFDSQINPDDTQYSDQELQKRNMIHFMLYEQELNELFSYIKDKGSFLFAISQPFNYAIPPKKSCDASMDEFIKGKLDEAIELIRKKDFKKAYTLTKELILIANSNAKIFYIHGKVAENLGYFKESKKSLTMSIALDCSNWRGSPVYNKILSKVARKNEVTLFDFDNYLYKEKNKNITFEDEIYPQNLYLERMIDRLSDRIKKRLKL